MVITGYNQLVRFGTGSNVLIVDLKMSNKGEYRCSLYDGYDDKVDGSKLNDFE